MKFLSIILVLPILLDLVVPQEPILKGRYKIVFEKEFSSQNGTVSFDKTSYKRVLINGKLTSGKIDYQKFRIILKDNDNVLQMILDNDEIGKDTISFSTIDISKKVEPDILIDEGKLIKLK